MEGDSRGLDPRVRCFGISNMIAGNLTKSRNRHLVKTNTEVYINANLLG